MGFVRHRETARVLVQAGSGRYLLMYSHWSPESGLEPRWVSPGGGLESGEPLSVAVSRELFEETGYRLKPEDFGPLEASIEFSQPWANGDYETGVAHFFRIHVEDEFEVDRSFWTADEHRDILEVRWWHPAELFASGERLGPPGLAELLSELG